MSRENVEIVRRAFAALERSGVAGLLEFCSPEIEYRVRYDLPDARTYHGHDGVRALAADWQAMFEEFQLEAQALIDAGDDVVAVMRISGRGATSGIEIGNHYAALCSVRERRLWRITDYPTKKEALEAVGLPESE